MKTNDTNHRRLTLRSMNIKFNGDRPSVGVIKNDLDHLKPYDDKKRMELNKLLDTHQKYS